MANAVASRHRTVQRLPRGAKRGSISNRCEARCTPPGSAGRKIRELSVRRDELGEEGTAAKARVRAHAKQKRLSDWFT